MFSFYSIKTNSGIIQYTIVQQLCGFVVRGWDIPTFVSYRPNQFYFMEYPLHIVNILTFSCVQVYGILTDSIADEPSNWGQ